LSTVGNLLYRLLLKYSPTGREEEAVEELSRWASEKGLQTWIDGIGNVYISPPGPKRALVLLAGHIDTVEGWIEPGIDAGRVWGRGAVDAKGPLASMAAAILELSRENPGCPAAAVGLVGEEGDSRGAWFLVSQNGVPPYVVIGEPSGGDRVVVGYRGGFHAEIECRGAGGHSSSPAIGDSALDKAVRLYIALKNAYPGEEPGKPSAAVTGLESGEAWNVLPRKALLRVDVRVPPGHSLESVKDELARLAGDHGCSTRFSQGVPPIRVKTGDPVPRSLVRSLLQQGVRPRPVVKMGTSDMNILGPRSESIAAYGPGDPRMAHTGYEEVSIRELELAVKVYSGAVRYLCRSTGKASAAELPS